MRINRLAVLTACLLCALGARAQGTAAIQDHCSEGGTQALLSGMLSTNYQQGIIPSCTVTVYLTGTQTPATIFADSAGTPLSNPFTANTAQSLDPGGWIFWAAVNTGYDIVLSGGISPNTYPQPVTLTDRYPGFSFSGGDSGVTPCGNVGQIQIANAAGTALNCDPNFFINAITHTYSSTTGNMLIGALSSAPRLIYDPEDTKYDGGLTAALAGSSGFTPTQVIQAAVDYGECQFLMGVAKDRVRIPLPAGVTIPIGQILLWANMDFGGDSLTNHPNLQHNDSTKIMVAPHGGTDQITCSNGTIYTPGFGGGLFIHDFGVAGMGQTVAVNDIAISISGGSMVSEITGFGNSFADQVILEQGLQNFIWRVGYPASQLKGCQAFVSGLLPVSSSITPGICTSVEMNSIDSEMDYVYATDGVQNATGGHTAGPCYPNCAAISVATNAQASNLFGQISDVDYIVNGFNIKGVNWRSDGTSREGVIFRAGANGNQISGIVIIAPCTDTALQSAYNAGTPTGCGGINDLGNSNNVTGVTVGGNSNFGASFTECSVRDTNVGASPQPNSYGGIAGRGDPNNLTRNDKFYCGTMQGDNASGRAVFPSMAPTAVTGASANVSGITEISLATTTPLTSIQGGIGGQNLLVYGIAGSSIANNTNIQTCDGLPENPTTFPVMFNNAGGYATSGGTPNNFWREVCNTPQNNYVHLNWTGNPTPTDPAVVDIYGNQTIRKVPDIAWGSSFQLHGPAAPSGQYCFEQENVYADGSDNVTPLQCTTIDLTAQTPGGIFGVFSPLSVTENLYLVSNSTGSGIPTGKYPALVIVPGSPFWDGPTTIAAGGDGSTPPGVSQNTTGMVRDQWGVVNNTTANTQPPCNLFTRGRQWMISGGGTGPDTFQICIETTGSTFAWVTH